MHYISLLFLNIRGHFKKKKIGHWSLVDIQILNFRFEQSAMLFLNSTKLFLTMEDVGRIGVEVVFRNLLFRVMPLLVGLSRWPGEGRYPKHINWSPGFPRARFLDPSSSPHTLHHWVPSYRHMVSPTISTLMTHSSISHFDQMIQR